MNDKAREKNFMQFYMNLREYIAKEERKITAECEKYGVNCLDPHTDISKMPKDVFDYPPWLCCIEF